MGPYELSCAIREFRGRFLIPTTELIDDRYRFLRLCSPAMNVENELSRYVDFTFSDDCGLLAGQSILVDVLTNYVIGIKPKDSARIWFIFKDAQGDRNTIAEKMASLGNDSVELDVSSQYSAEGGFPDVGYASIGNAMINMFKMDNIKLNPLAVKRGFDLFLLLVVEPARCMLLEEVIIPRLESWLPVSSRKILEVARHWGGGTGPKDKISGSKVVSALSNLSIDGILEVDKENIPAGGDVMGF